MLLKTSLKQHKLIILPIAISGIILYMLDDLQLGAFENKALVFSFLFSSITLPAILKTVFTTPHKTKQGNTQQSDFTRIIVSLVFTSILFYISSFLSALFCLMFLSFHFGENDLKLRTGYIWNLCYGTGLIGLYISHNWTKIISYSVEQNLITDLQSTELNGLNFITQNTITPFLFLFLLGVFMSWKIRRNFYPFTLIFIPIAILFLSPSSFIFLYLFIWKPLNELMEIKAEPGISISVSYLLLGLLIGFSSYAIFKSFSAEQSILLAFTGICFTIPYTIKMHELIKLSRRTELFRKLNYKRELKEEREQLEIYNWEKKLLNKIHLSAIKYKEPNKI